MPVRIGNLAPRWKHDLPRVLYGLLTEIYDALYADGRRLAIMGARTVVDIVMREQLGEDRGSFQKQLEGLEEKGLIGKKNREFLAAALDAGSAAAHRGYIPKAEEVDHVMNIVENVLEAVYILEKAAEGLKQSTPPREKP